jgi:uridine kinase
VKIYVHADSDERLIRRMKEISSVAVTLQVINRYQNTLKPMHEQFIEPTTKLLLISLYQTTNTSHRCGSSSNKQKIL